jgi:hypothetical protein
MGVPEFNGATSAACGHRGQAGASLAQQVQPLTVERLDHMTGTPHHHHRPKLRMAAPSLGARVTVSGASTAATATGHRNHCRILLQPRRQPTLGPSTSASALLLTQKFVLTTCLIPSQLRTQIFGPFTLS